MSTTAPVRGEEDEPTARVSAYSSCPERTVFIERANPDGWIATDLTVGLDR